MIKVYRIENGVKVVRDIDGKKAPTLLNLGWHLLEEERPKPKKRGKKKASD